MSDSECEPVAVSRRIDAPADVIFRVLCDPARHADLDGSDMLRGAVSTEPVSAVGDVFVMKMTSRKCSDYETNNHIVEFEPGRLISWEPVAGRGHPNEGKPALGHRWSFRLEPEGASATVVTEIYDCSRAPEDERRGMDNGNLWVESMHATLERLDSLCTSAQV